MRDILEPNEYLGQQYVLIMDVINKHGVDFLMSFKNGVKSVLVIDEMGNQLFGIEYGDYLKNYENQTN